jgi:hypothetical protein
MPEPKTSRTSIQPVDSLSKTVPLSTKEPSKVAHMGNNLDSMARRSEANGLSLHNEAMVRSG